MSKNTLIKQIQDKISKETSPEWAEEICNKLLLNKNVCITIKQLEYITKQRKITSNDRKLYEFQQFIPTSQQPVSLIHEEAPKGLLVEKLTNTLELDISNKRYKIPGSSGHSRHFYTDGSPEPATDVMALTNLLSTIIKDENIYAASLNNQPHLTNTLGENGCVITSSLQYNYFRENLPAIKQLGVQALVVESYYKPGLYIGTQHAYVCDVLGHVVGITRGRDLLWYDQSSVTPEGSCGDGYCVRTLATRGPQRLNLYSTQSTPYHRYQPPAIKTYNIFASKIELPKPNFTIGLTYNDLEEKHTTLTPLETDFSEELKHFIEPEMLPTKTKYSLPSVKMFHYILYLFLFVIYSNLLLFILYYHNVISQRYKAIHVGYYALSIIYIIITISLSLYYYYHEMLHNALSCLFDGLKGILSTFVFLNLVTFSAIINGNTIWFSLGTVLVILSLVTIDRLCTKDIIVPHIYLTFEKPEFVGEDSKDLYRYYESNPTDELGLPWGFYAISKDGLNVVQVNQRSSNCNYTNIHKMVIAFNNSKCHSGKSSVAKYLKNTLKINFKIFDVEDYSFLDRQESPIKRITCKGEYMVHYKDQHGVDIKLESREQWREYLSSQLTTTVIAAATENRALPGGYDTVFSEEEHQKLYSRFWRKYVGKTYHDVQEEPNHETFYKGKSKHLRKYRSVFGRFGEISYKAVYTTFMKIESLPLKSFIKKATRFIFPNTPHFNLSHLNLFHAFEKDLLAIEVNGLPLFAKGLNWDQTLTAINKHLKRHRYVLSVDFSNFDAHHKDKAYKGEMNFYGEIGLDAKTVESLKNPMITGIVDLIGHCHRMSGDLFTGSGNCLVVASMLEQFFGPNCSILCNGDDTLIFCDDTSIKDNIVAALKLYGHELTIDKITDTHTPGYMIPFCQLFYRKEDYKYNWDRMRNKIMNITGPTSEDFRMAAQTILGKLQSFPFLKAIGASFDVDVCHLLDIVDTTEEMQYKKDFLAKGATMICPDDVYEFQFRNREGLISKIILELEKDRKLRTLTYIHDKLNNIYTPQWTQRNLRKCLIKTIQRTLVTAYADQEELPEDLKIREAQLEYIEQNFGLKSLTQVLAARRSIEKISQVGSKSTPIYTSHIKCTRSESAGTLDIQHSQEDGSMPPLTQTRANPKKTSHSKPSVPNKTQQDQSSQATESSTSQQAPGSHNQAEDNVVEKTPTYSTSDTTSTTKEQLTQAKSPSSSNTMSPSIHHKLTKKTCKKRPNSSSHQANTHSLTSPKTSTSKTQLPSGSTKSHSGTMVSSVGCSHSTKEPAQVKPTPWPKSVSHSTETPTKHQLSSKPEPKQAPVPTISIPPEPSQSTYGPVTPSLTKPLQVNKPSLKSPQATMETISTCPLLSTQTTQTMTTKSKLKSTNQDAQEALYNIATSNPYQILTPLQ